MLHGPDADSALRNRARELIQQGQLPDALRSRVWGGKGSGGPCALCSLAILHDDAEYEVAVPSGKESSLRFHFHCFAAWQLECIERNTRTLDSSTIAFLRADR